jgi:hypothetical protein
VTAVGLSGLLYGLCGYLYALRNHRDFAARVVTERFTKTIFGWLILCYVLTYFGAMRVANWAHLGGLVVGWLAGRAELTRFPKPPFAALTALVIAMAAATQWMPWIPQYRLHRALRDRTPLHLEEIRREAERQAEEMLRHAPPPVFFEGDDP